MRPRNLLAVPLASVAVLAFAGAVFAGGWASVSMTDPPTDITPGDETTVEMTVLQHGQTPIDWPRLTVVATQADTGETVRADAAAVRGELGQYRALLVLPTDGEWAVTYESSDLVMDGSASLAVAPIPDVAVVPPAEAAPIPTPAAVATPATLFGPILVVATIVAVGLGAALLMRRRHDAIDQREQPATSRG
jgi:hypothetical protein